MVNFYEIGFLSWTILAKQIHNAIKGLGTRENVLIEVFTSRTNAQIAQIKQAYLRLFQKSLEKDVIGDTSEFR